MTMPAMKREIERGYDETLERVVDALKSEGFGVLTEIDVKTTLEQKLDVDFRRYTILGACNPPLAYRALSSDLDVGVLLPCNVVVYEKDDDTTFVSAVDPLQALGPFGAEGFGEIAGEVKAKLTRVMEKIG